MLQGQNSIALPVKVRATEGLPQSHSISSLASLHGKILKASIALSMYQTPAQFLFTFPQAFIPPTKAHLHLKILPHTLALNFSLSSFLLIYFHLTILTACFLYISVLPNPKFVPVKITVNPSKGSKASQVVNLNKLIEFLPKIMFSICKHIHKQNIYRIKLRNAGFDEPKHSMLTKKKKTTFTKIYLLSMYAA